MKFVIGTTFILATLLLVGYAKAETAKNETSSTDAAPTKKPKIDVLKSSVCKKCKCNADTSLLDCTRLLNGWFSETEWDILQNGDIIFDTFKLEHNNLTTIPALPTYAAKNLFLGYNQIAEIAIGAFQNWTELTNLDLSNNNLTATALLPDVFKGPYSANDFEPLKNLKFLNLGYNKLHTLNDDLFEHLEFLEELVLCSNTFQIIDRSTEVALSQLQKLKTLDISYMELDSLPETLLHAPIGLETFIASGNLFKQLPKALTYAKNLKRLVLDENPIGNLEKENIFPALVNLQYLSLTYMPDLYRIEAGALSELQNLTDLILSENPVLMYIDENALSKNITGGEYLDYPPLDKLYLNYCNLTTIPKNLIVRWDKLSELNLKHNPWTCDMSNEFLIKVLIPLVNKNNPKFAENVQCATPENLKDVEVLKVSKNNQLYDASSGGSVVWILLFVSVILLIPMVLVGFVLYKRGYCRFGRNNEAARRALYSRTSFNEEFHI